MRKSTTSVNFRRMTGITLENFAEGVLAGIFGNILVFLLPPMTKIILQGLITDYSNARLAYESGGTADLPLYNKTMKALVAGLNLFAPYVDTIALGDIPTIKMAGFKATFDPANAKGGPIVEEYLTLKRPEKGTGILISECSSYDSGTTFLAFLTERPLTADDITIIDSIFFDLPIGSTLKIRLCPTRQNKKIWTGLKMGVLYYCVYIIINSAGVSSFSNVATMMCG